MNDPTGDSPVLNGRSAPSRWEFLICLGVLIAATYLLAPRFWEPGAESWKNWVSARILRETGGFTELHHGPLYNLYLQLFLFLDYPLSLNLEHALTRLFAYAALFLLLRKFLPSVPALLLTCAWIPALWPMEAGARVAGIGFLALYLRRGKHAIMNGGYVPASLASAFLCDLALLPFFLGHVIGVVLERRFNREPLVTAAFALRRKTMLPVIVKSALVLLLALAMFFQSDRPDNNVHAFYYPWSPVPQKVILTQGFFQLGNWKYVKENVPESDWIYQDWYFTHKQAFGGASNLLEAVRNKPAFVWGIILDNLRATMVLPFRFVFGFGFPSRVGLVFVSWILLGIGLWGVFQYCLANRLQSLFSSLVLGTMGVVAGLSLYVVAPRFFVVLLPVGLMVIVHIAAGFRSIIQSAGVRAAYNIFVVKARIKESGIYRGFGCVFILLGLGLMVVEGSLLAMISSGWAVTKHPAQFYILIVEIFLIVGGALLIIKPEYFLGDVKRRDAFQSEGMQIWFASAVIPLLAGAILVMTYNPFGVGEGIRETLGYRYLLAGKSFSMIAVHKQLLNGVDRQTKVLAAEAPWISAFADVNLDNVYHPLVLPPFKDSSGETAKLLDSLDVIWVSNRFSKRQPSTATQEYLRYLLHVEPFLEKALTSGWTMEHAEGFGKIYRRPKPHIS